MESSLLEESNPRLSAFELTPTLIPYFIGFFVFRGFFTNFPLYLQIKQNLSEHRTVQIWSIISGVALLIGALTRLPAGLLSDKIGRIRAFIFAYSVYFVALIVILVSTNSIIYIIGMSLIRLGVNTIAMTGRSVVSTANRDRALKNGLLSSMVGLGSFSGPFLLGYVLDHYNPDTILYLSFILISVDIILFFVFHGIVDTWFEKQAYDQDLNYDPIEKGRDTSYGAALRTDGVGEIFFLYFSAGFVYGLITQIYSIYGFNILFLSTTTIGLITGLGALVQTFWAPTTGRLYNYIKDEYLRIFAWILIVLGAFSAALSGFATGFFIASFFILSFGNSTYFTVEITRLSHMIRASDFSLIFGLASSLIILATSITGFISPFLYDIFPEFSFYCAVVVAFIGLLTVILRTPKWKRKRMINANSV